MDIYILRWSWLREGEAASGWKTLTNALTQVATGFQTITRGERELTASCSAAQEPAESKPALV